MIKKIVYYFPLFSASTLLFFVYLSSSVECAKNLSNKAIESKELQILDALQREEYWLVSILAKEKEQLVESNTGAYGLLINALFPMQLLCVWLALITNALFKIKVKSDRPKHGDGIEPQAKIDREPLIIEEDTGYVYFIYSASHNLTKIGKSGNPKKRFSAIKTASPEGHSLQLVGTIKSKSYNVLEEGLHTKFADRRKSGEWFSIGIEEAKNEIISHGGEIISD